MTLAYLRLTILSLLTLVFAGYHTACACAHAAQAVSVSKTVHHAHDMSMADAEDCHSDAEAQTDSSHDCPRFLDRLDVKSVSLIKPEMVSLKLVAPSVSVENSFASLWPDLKQAVAIRPPPNIKRRIVSPLTLKVRLLN